MLKMHKILHIFSGIFLYMFNLYAANIRIPITGINIANIIATPNVIIIHPFFRHLYTIYSIVILSSHTIYCVKKKSVFHWLFESLKRPIYGHSKTSVFSTTPFLITFVGTLLSIIDVINIIQVFLLL